MFSETRGSWESSTDSRYKGFWITTLDWDVDTDRTADAYLDSNQNGSWDSTDEKLERPQAFGMATMQEAAGIDTKG